MQKKATALSSSRYHSPYIPSEEWFTPLDEPLLAVVQCNFLLFTLKPTCELSLGNIEIPLSARFDEELLSSIQSARLLEFGNAICINSFTLFQDFPMVTDNLFQLEKSEC